MGTLRLCAFALTAGFIFTIAAAGAAQTPASSAPPASTPPPPLLPDPIPPPVDAVSGDPTAPEPTPEPPPEPPPPPLPEPAPPPPPPPPPPPMTTEDPEFPMAGLHHSRRGFFFSAGFGSSVTRWFLDLEINDSNASIASFTDLGFASQLKVGFGVHDQAIVHFTHRAAWLRMWDPVALDPQRTMLHVAALTGAGASYFFDASPRSGYAGLDLGIAHWLEPKEIDRDWSNVHFGVCGSVGYEFTANVSFEHSLCWAAVESESRDVEPGIEADAVTGAPLWASFTLNYLSF